MRKAIHASIILGLLLFLATGCSSNSKGASSAAPVSATAASAAPASTPAATVAPTPAAPAKVELNVFMSYAQYKDQFDKYFDQFKAKELALKNVEVTIKAEMPSSDQAEQILKTRLASNDAPDLFTI